MTPKATTNSRLDIVALLLLSYCLLIWVPILLKVVGLLPYSWLQAFLPLIINWVVLLLACLAFVLVGQEPQH